MPPLFHHPNKRFDSEVAEQRSDSRNDVCFLAHETEAPNGRCPGVCRPSGITVPGQADDPAF
jgi:hypothetical protein